MTPIQRTVFGGGIGQADESLSTIWGVPSEIVHVSRLKLTTKHGALSDPSDSEDATPSSLQPGCLFCPSQQLQVMGIGYRKDELVFVDDPSDGDMSNDDQSSSMNSSKSALENAPPLVLHDESLPCLSPVESHSSQESSCEKCIAFLGIIVNCEE